MVGWSTNVMDRDSIYDFAGFSGPFLGLIVRTLLLRILGPALGALVYMLLRDVGHAERPWRV